MVKEAESNAEDDRRKKEEIDVRNEAEALIYNSGKVIKEFGDKVPSDLKKSIEDSSKELEEKLKSENVEEIKKCMDLLQNKVYELSTKMYQQQAESKKDDKKKDDNIVDADFKVEKDNK